ncbi:MAG: chromosomal replication initiator protein DnaA, partial [Chitinophagales bacterium]|nr:chromosomal replication initiator protein DnaA [Chitinophagales bacterium]
MAQNVHEIWEKALEVIKSNLREQEFEIFFKPIKPLSYINCVFKIEVPSQFFYEWIEEHYVDLMRKTLEMQLGEKVNIEYNVLMKKQKT